jgi:DRTGG domain
MLLSDIAELLGGEPVLGLDGWRHTEVAGCFAADLMSEVLAFCGHGAVLLTGLSNVQSIHTAHLADLRAIVFVNDKRPDEAVLALARARGLPLFSTPLTLYEACGRLHERGLADSRKGA